MSVLSNIYDQMSSAASYRPGNTTIFDDMTLEAGDVITVTSGEKSHTTALNTVDLTWNGSAMMTVGAQGQQKRDSLTKLSRKKYAGTVGGSGGGWGYRNSKKAYTEIIQNDEMIQLVATKTGINELGEDETLYGKITVTAEAIESEVSRATSAEGTLSSRITQTAESIESEVSRATSAEGTLSSRITQEADRISLVVEGTGSGASVKRAAIIAAINEDGSSTASIQASKITIGGGNLSNVIWTDGTGSVVNATSIAGTTGLITNAFITNLSVASSGTQKSATWCTFTVDGTTLDQKFLGDGNINFNVADTAKYKADIGIKSLSVDADTPTTYTEATNMLNFKVIGVPNAGANAEKWLQADASPAYSIAYAKGQSDEAKKYTPTTVTLQGTKTVVYKRGTERPVTLQGTKTVVYTRKSTASTGTKIGTKHENALYDYETFKVDGRTTIKLYYKDGDIYKIAGTYTWYHGGTKKTLYEAGSPYTLYESTGTDDYYAEGTPVTLYEDGGWDYYYAEGKPAVYYTKDEESTGT